MMKNILLVSIILLLLNCQGQIKKNNSHINNEIDTIMERSNKRLNIDSIKKNGHVLYQIGTHSVETTYDEYEYVEEFNTKNIRIWGNEKSGFFEEVIYKNQPITEQYNYLGNGILISWKKQSAYGFLIEEKEYNEEGYLKKHLDFDNLFKFDWEKVKLYLDSLNVNTDVNAFKNFPYPNKDIPIPQIERGLIKDAYHSDQYPSNIKKLWYLNGVEGVYGKVTGIFYIVLDGDTGEELLVKQFLGKKSGDSGTGTYSNFKVLYSKKEDEKRSASIYRTYKGKSYTKKEWEAFEAKEFEDYAQQHNLNPPKDAVYDPFKPKNS